MLTMASLAKTSQHPGLGHLGLNLGDLPGGSRESAPTRTHPGPRSSLGKREREIYVYISDYNIYFEYKYVYIYMYVHTYKYIYT